MKTTTLAKQCNGKCMECKHKRLCDRKVRYLIEYFKKRDRVNKEI